MDEKPKDQTLVDDTLAGAAPSTTAAATPPGGEWRYQVADELARGGLGRILIARDATLDRVVAIKELLVAGGVGEQRFMREARLTAQLEHPAIVPVHDAGARPGAGTPFYAMKLVSGRPLKDAVEATTNLHERLALLPNVLAVCEAVAYAHSRRIIHRDLKPDNVILGAYGETVVIDWGLAKALDEQAGDDDDGPLPESPDNLTIAGAVMGTPAFMAPEQARGERVDERADVYALGALIYHVLAGKPPYEGTTGREVVALVRVAAPAPLRERVPVPDDLAAIVSKAMARAPADRYPHAGELAADLKRFLNGQLVAAHSYSWPEQVARFARRHRGAALATAVFVLAALVGGAWFLVREQRLRHVAEAERARADSERVRADDERARAERQSIALLEQQGRDQLAAGRPFRAAVYLSAAYRRDPGRLALKYLVSEALGPLDLRSGTLTGHHRDVVAVAYDPGGRYAVSASSDGTARIWDVEAGTTVHVLEGHTDPLNYVAVSRDGVLVATGASDKSIRIYRLDSGELQRRIDDPDPYRLMFLADGLLVVASHTGQLRVRDVSTGALRLEVSPHKGRVYTLAMSPDGARFVTGGWDGVTIVWDAHTLKEIARLTQRGQVSSVTYTRDGRWLLITGADGPIVVRDAQTLVEMRQIVIPAEARWSTVWPSPDEQTVVTTSFDGSVRVWHLASGALLRAFDAEPDGKLFTSALRPDGRELVTAGVGGLMHVWRITDGAAYRFVLPTAPGAPALLPSLYADGGRLLVLALSPEDADGGEIQVRRSADGKLLRHFRVPVSPGKIASDPGAHRILVSGEDVVLSKDSGVWDADTGTMLSTLGAHEGRVFNVAASPDGALFASAGRDKSARLWDAKSGAPVGKPLYHATRVSCVGFDPTSALLATGSDGGLLTLWSVQSGERLYEVQASPTWIQDVQFSADGKRIITAGRQDHTAKIWNAADGTLLVTLTGHGDNLMSGSFSPDGRLAATVSVDGHAKLWDAQSGELLRSWVGPAYTAAFSADGSTLFTTGNDGYALFWTLAPDERSPEQIASYVAERSPWILSDGKLVLASTAR